MCTKTSEGQHRITTDEALRYIVRVSGHASRSCEAGIGLTSRRCSPLRGQCRDCAKCAHRLPIYSDPGPNNAAIRHLGAQVTGLGGGSQVAY